MNNSTAMMTAAALLLSACGSPSTHSSDGNSTTATETAAPIALGKTGSAKGVNYTVTAVTTPKSIGAAGIGTSAEKGETFVVVAYTMKNTGAAALPFMERPHITLEDAKGQSYATDDMGTGMSVATMSDPSGMASDLNPNVSAKAKAAWKVDKASFDKATWHVVVAADPSLTFALK